MYKCCSGSTFFVYLLLLISLCDEVCINADIGQLFFREIFRKINMINIKTMNE